MTSLFPDPATLYEPAVEVDPTLPIDLRLFPGGAQVGPSGALSIAGVDLLELCEEIGTPVFVYDEDQLRRRCREALVAWGPGVAYASKAFLCRAMAALVAEEGLCIDVATGGELHVALAGGIPPERVVVHGNNKSDAELLDALRAGAGRIIVDSFDEIERLERLAPAVGVRPAVLIRVTPGIEAHTHEFVRTGQDDSKFGFGMASGAAEDAVEQLRRPESPVELVGIHFHIGSQIFAVESFAQAIAVVAPFFDRLGLDELCVGGGLGVPYVAGETSPTITEWAATMRAACAAAGISALVRLSAEPGRAVVAGAAVTCYTVGTIKQLPGLRTYVSVDGGMSDNPRPVLYGSGYEAARVRDIGARRPFVAHLVGKHCESGDVIVRNAHLPAGLAVGDVVVTPVTGAYGHSMASVYNKVPRPPVVFATEGAWRVVVRRETFADLLALDL